MVKKNRKIDPERVVECFYMYSKLSPLNSQTVPAHVFRAFETIGVDLEFFTKEFIYGLGISAAKSGNLRHTEVNLRFIRDAINYILGDTDEIPKVNIKETSNGLLYRFAD